MKKSILIFGIVLVVIVGGVWYGKTLLTKKMGEQVVNILQTPGVQDQINNLVKSSQNSPDVQNAISSALDTTVPGGNSAANPQSQTSVGTGETNTSGNQVNTAKHSGSTSTDSGSTGSAGSSTSINPPPVKSSPTPAPTPALNNRADAVQYAMTRFSPSEIMHYMAVYQNRQNLTQDQKNEIKSEILSRFTPQELQALSAAANK